MQGNRPQLIPRARGVWCVLLMGLLSLGLFAQGDPATTLEQSRLLAQSGQLEDAQIILDDLEDTVPEALRDDFLYTRGLVLTQLGHWQAAREDFAQLSQRDPGFYPAHYMAGFAALNGGQAKAALPHFQAALELEPGRLAPQMQVALCLEQLGKTDEAFKKLTGLVKKHPDFAPAREALAHNYFRSRNVGKARTLLAGLPEGTSLSGAGLALLGQIHLMDGDHEQALALLAQAREAGFFDQSALHNLSLLAFEGEDLSLSQETNQDVRSLNPNSADAILHQGLLAQAEGREPQAEKLWEGLVKRKDASWQARYNLALLRARTGRLQQSLSTLGPLKRGAEEPFPVRLLRASLHLAKGDYAQAGPAFEELVQDNPDSLPARINMAFLYLAAQEWELAQPHIEWALAQPDTLPTVVALADVMLAAQQAELAGDIYQMALAETPEDPELVIKTATAFLDSGREDEAQQLFQDYDTLVSGQAASGKGK